MSKCCENCDHKNVCEWREPTVGECHYWDGWHDAITDPPNDERQILIYGTNYHYAIGKYMTKHHCYVRSDAWTVNDMLKGVIAWRERPEFSHTSTEAPWAR